MHGRTIWAIAILKCLEEIHKARGDNSPISKRVISDHIGISKDYIEQIVVPMKNAGLMESIRGLRGGFMLSVDQLTIAQLRDIMEPKVDHKKKHHEIAHGLLDHYFEQVRYLDNEIKIIG
jgi:DNA-binding IscR family transcriptional regulator